MNASPAPLSPEDVAAVLATLDELRLVHGVHLPLAIESGARVGLLVFGQRL